VLYLNGHRVGENYFDPGFSTVPSIRLLYSTFNVTQMLLNGENAIGARLGMCKYSYLNEFCSPEGSLECRAFLLQLNVEVEENGLLRKYEFHTDHKKWNVTTGPIIYDHLYHGIMIFSLSSLSLIVGIFF